MAVAHEINKVLKKDDSKLLIGSIAPDIAKQIGETKKKSHFLDDDNSNIPNIDRFLFKYKNNMNDDFVLGYFIHLYTDYLWFKYFIPEIYDSNNNMISKVDGNTVKCNGKMLEMYIYNDYSNLNTRLLDEYNMDLSIFYNEVPFLENIIEEIPMDKIRIIIDKTALIITKSKEHKDFLFNMTNIKNFINLSVELTMAKLKELNIT
ncbi:MAG: zinc dependent phospholipase C family protein [Bacilli bacterium]|nr:zinc dependent phospholipase C family protein [Bacilli bacterium]